MVERRSVLVSDHAVNRVGQLKEDDDHSEEDEEHLIVSLT